MRSQRAPLFGLAIGSAVMGTALLGTAWLSSVHAARPCEPLLAEQAEEQVAGKPNSREPIKLISLALPAPPPHEKSMTSAVAVEGHVAPKAKALAPVKRRMSVEGSGVARPINSRASVQVASTSPAPPPSPGAPAIKVASKPENASHPASRPVIAGRDQEVEGRPLLRMLEHGKGPSVEIAWPDHRVARAKLYELLKRCHGLETVLLRGEQVLMSPSEGVAKNFNTDRHSGFLRAIFGASPRRELEVLAALRLRHGDLGATPARLLSRDFDARLLGGLGRIVGPRYRNADTVTARYALAGRRVLVSGIAVDGVKVEGRVEIGPVSRCYGS